MRQAQSCHVSNDTLAYARALTPQSHNALYISRSRCVWVKGFAIHSCIGYHYREVYRIEYIDRLYIFLVNRYWLSATQSSQTVCYASYTVSNRIYVLVCPFLLVNWCFFFPLFIVLSVLLFCLDARVPCSSACVLFCVVWISIQRTLPEP